MNDTRVQGGRRASPVETMIETNQSHGGIESRDEPQRGPDQARAWARGEDGEFPLELRATTLAELCEAALADVAGRFPERRIEYYPDPEPDRRGAGEWDPRRVAYAVTILLEDALKRTREADAVTLAWREDDDGVTLRVRYSRPLERGDRFVTYFEDGVRPDGADDSVGTLRIVVALAIARQHRGTLARIRTHAGTAYVLELPRTPAERRVTDDDVPGL